MRALDRTLPLGGVAAMARRRVWTVGQSVASMIRSRSSTFVSCLTERHLWPILGRTERALCLVERVHVKTNLGAASCASGT